MKISKDHNHTGNIKGEVGLRSIGLSDHLKLNDAHVSGGGGGCVTS